MESDDSLSLKSKSYFSTAVKQWDSDFYVKVDDDIFVNIGKHMCIPFASLCFLGIHSSPCFKKTICAFLVFLTIECCFRFKSQQ